tara:strand:- start:218 stop:424 length:207 start_codon:yes stop_codon:yes gene_type:complete
MANLQTLKTNHYKSQLIPTKKLKMQNNTYYGFKLNELIDYKLYKLEYDFTHKGLTFINKNKLSKNLYI